MKKIEQIIKNNIILQRLYIFFGSLFIKFLGLFIRQDKRLILFSSFSGRSFNDSPKLIFEEIKQKFGDEYEYVWAFIEPNNFSIHRVNKVKLNSLKYFLIALKAKYWVTNVNIERGLHFKKKNCVYLNTWHGVCLDYIGNDRPGRKDYNFKNLNFICVSSDFDKLIYKKAFNTNENQYLECGMPRNDQLINMTNNEKEVKSELNISSNKKIILYAPTWRENFSDHTDDKFISPLHISKWKKELGDKYILLFRAHSISKKLFGIEFDDFCIDVSDYSNTNRLLSIVDILVTDYSSIALDFALLSKPIFNFGFDYEEYCSKHGFYVDYAKEMPNGIIKDEDKLISSIKTVNLEVESKKTKAFADKYLNYTNGRSTDICVRKLLGK